MEVAVNPFGDRIDVLMQGGAEALQQLLLGQDVEDRPHGRDL